MPSMGMATNGGPRIVGLLLIAAGVPAFGQTPSTLIPGRSLGDRIEASFFTLSSIPMTESEATGAGWTMLGSGCNPRYGKRYAHPDFLNMIMGYDAAGQSATIQFVSPAGYPLFPATTTNPSGLFFEPDPDVTGQNIWTVHTSDPDTICTTPAPRTGVSVGDRVWLKLVNAMDGQYDKIPLNLTHLNMNPSPLYTPFELIDGHSTWMMGGCTPAGFLGADTPQGMGLHIQNARLQQDGYPLTLLYGADNMLINILAIWSTADGATPVWPTADLQKHPAGSKLLEYPGACSPGGTTPAEQMPPQALPPLIPVFHLPDGTPGKPSIPDGYNVINSSMPIGDCGGYSLATIHVYFNDAITATQGCSPMSYSMAVAMDDEEETTPSTLIPGHSVGDRISASFFTLTSLPITEPEAVTAGWTMLGSGCNPRYGRRYAHPDILNMIIGYDELGQTATIQFVSPVGYPLFPHTTTNPDGLFFERDPDVTGQHIWTVHTSDPNTICNNPAARSSDSIGDRIWMKLVNAMDGKYDKIPMNLTHLNMNPSPLYTPFELIKGHSTWMMGGCTPAGFVADFGIPHGMGLHIQNARLQQDGYPLTLLYGADNMLINILSIWSTDAGKPPVWPTVDGGAHPAGSQILEYPGACAPGGTTPADQMPPQALPPLIPVLHDANIAPNIPAGTNLMNPGGECGNYSLATIHVYLNDPVGRTIGCSPMSAQLAQRTEDPAPSIADLPRCNSKLQTEYNYPRTLETPRELLDGGKFRALRPRSDWITVHDFDFPPSPPGAAHAAVFTEMGSGVGGAYANAQMCVANGAPAGCPDLRLAFGPGPVPFNWSQPAHVQAAIGIFNQSLSPICNIVRKRHGPMRLDILDLCLDTDKEDSNYWYLKAMMDFEMTRLCQGAPPSCRLVKMGKPTGNDPTYWEESWDTWGALSYNATHITRAAWYSCPNVMQDPNNIPCNFGSLSSSTNCDAWFAPNIAPPKRSPPEPWLPGGLQAHPTGPSVIAHFCGDGCEWDGEVPPMPPLSAYEGDGRQAAGSTVYPACPAGCRPFGPRPPPPPNPSIADLPACNTKPMVGRNYPRTLQTPQDLLDAGKFRALRPRSDWITVHDFDFPPSPPGESHAAVFTEMGSGVGGAYANAQMCIANGAPAGCPDLRLAFGPGPFPFNWSNPVSVQTAVAVFNQSLSPICNIVKKRHGPMRLDILDLCLDTEKSDSNYWYLKAMMDFEMTRLCQGAPPSCRLVKMGKPTGNDPTYWEESWDTWGALSYNATHIIEASWMTCPNVMQDPNNIPCNFGSLSSSTNCDAWFAPNVAPPKREPPEPWLPGGLQAHPTGPSVIAHFCGDACEWDGEVPPMPPMSAYEGDGRQIDGLMNYPGCPAGCRPAGPRPPVPPPPSINDLPACNSMPMVAHHYRRTLRTPHELLDAGKFRALRPRSDWITVHDFDFPPSAPGRSHAAVFTEMGSGVGGAYANAQMCIANGAPGGCPDLRLAFGFGPKPFNWSIPAHVQAAVGIFNQSLNPICNIVRKRHGPMRLDILDLCLDTEKSDSNYWYLKAMMDFEMTRACQGAPPSCRLVKMGKPGGNDPHYWEESWDTWGALSYNATHVTRASWMSCPNDMRDPDRIPCNFGSLSSSTNCDAWFAPNIAPPKRSPPEPWLPNGLQAHPTGPSVIAYFCGDACEWDGEVPPMPPMSAYEGDGRQTAGSGTYPTCPAGCRPLGPRTSPPTSPPYISPPADPPAPPADPPSLPPPPYLVCDSACQLGWGFAWAATVLLEAAFLYDYLRRSKPKEKVPFDGSILYCYCVSLCCEGVFYGIQTAATQIDWQTRMIVMDVVSVGQIINGIFIWTVAIMFVNFDKQKNVKRLICRFALIAMFLEVVYIVLAASGSMAKQMVFLLWFEPVFWVRIAACATIAGSLVGPAANYASWFLIIKFVLVISHLYSIMIIVNPLFEREWSTPVNRGLHCVLEPIACICLVQMARYGAFEARQLPHKKLTMEQIEIANMRTQAVKGTEGMWRTHYVYPERLWGYGVPGMFAAYFFSAALLFAVTQPDFARDPVYNLFGTFHTCMLLDYLPGAFAAYVFFAWQVLLQQACSIATFFRAVLAGNMMLTLWSAVATTWLYFATCQFPLVFIFNPSRTTVLAHSIPYMIHQSAVCLFWATGISQAFVWHRRRPGMIPYRHLVNFTAFACFYVLIVTYGLTFMAAILLETTGLGPAAGTTPIALVNGEEAFSEKFGSTVALDTMSNCTRDEAVMNKAFPWETQPSLLVGSNRFYDVNASDQSIVSLAWGADGTVNYTVGNADLKHEFPNMPGWRSGAYVPPPHLCDPSHQARELQMRIHSTCRKTTMEDDDWYTLMAMGEDTMLTECAGAVWGICSMMKVGKPTGAHAGEIHMSWPKHQVMEVEDTVVHLKWSMCPTNMYDPTLPPSGVSAGPRFVAKGADGPFVAAIEILPALLTVVIVGLVTAYRHVHPLSQLPLCMEVCSLEANRLLEGEEPPDLTPPLAESFSGRDEPTLRSQIRARYFFYIAMCIAVVCAIFSRWLGIAVLGEQGWEELHSFRDALAVQPAVTIVATLWTAMAGFILVYALMTSYHEMYHNSDPCMRFGTYVATLLLASGLLLAPCALVPATKQYWSDVFNGARYFQLMMIIWLMWNNILLLQRRFCSNPPAHFGCTWFIIELASSLTAVVLLAISILNHTESMTDILVDGSWLIPLCIWSIADTRCVTFYFEQVRVADQSDCMNAESADWMVALGVKGRRGRNKGNKFAEMEGSETAIVPVAKATSGAGATLPVASATALVAAESAQSSTRRMLNASAAGIDEDKEEDEDRANRLLEEINLLEAAIDATDESDPEEFRAELEQQLKERKAAYAEVADEGDMGI